MLTNYLLVKFVLLFSINVILHANFLSVDAEEIGISSARSWDNTSRRTRYGSGTSKGGSTYKRLSIYQGGSCSANDKNIWNTRNYDMKQALDSCGKSCWGASSCTSNCMTKKGKFSKQCSNCFGTFAGCSSSNCKWKCMFNTRASGCIKCVKRKCASSFVRCSGLSSPL